MALVNLKRKSLFTGNNFFILIKILPAKQPEIIIYFIIYIGALETRLYFIIIIIKNIKFLQN